ncbi:hypothetical protein BCIN_05g08310 [Botrytis cinerea B05.10]|uniref:Rhodopsin domain-containing protein n=1 Tax=Botryotinia fuckeliana (strain B05.10) TaxID=332648 RepID=A0A384JIU7_BOTFB|nr:hypothetical protein BCIN_05g08310 [Botrytis cinerea B05.10]ATZ50483.1 hypothetical protein BCIN_05g08310 [Botrytis cinerea B05.10]
MVTEAPDKQDEILIITLLFSGIACVAVALRCYVRTRLLKAFGVDDAIAVVSLFLLCAGVIFTILGVNSGFGQHNDTMTMEQYLRGLKWWCYSEIIYPPTIAIIKISIALYLVRIAVKPVHIYAIYISMAIFLLYTAAFFAFLLLQCRPISFYWRRFGGAIDGHCLHPSTIAGMAYGHGVVNVMADLTLGIIPAFIVADLQITTRTKVAVAMTLALGSIASICTLTRIAYINDLLHTDDYLYSIADVIILSIVEAAVGLIASCLATLKPLIRSFLDWSEKSIGSSGGLHTRMVGGMNRRRTRMYDTELNLRPDLAIVGFTTTVISSNGRESPPLHSSISQTMDVKGDLWLSPSSHESQKSHRRLESGNGDEAAVPACQIK